MRLDTLIKLRKSSNEKLSKIAGVSPAAISQWRTGTTNSPDALPLLLVADELGTSMRYILTGQGPMFTDSDFDPESEVRIPFYRYEFSAGHGANSDPWVSTTETLTFRREWLQKHNLSKKDLVIAKVNGSSMEKTLFNGDSIAISRALTEPLPGHIYAFSFEGHLFVKRFMIEPNKWSFVSDNPDGGRNKPIELFGDDRQRVKFEGRVVHRMGEGGL